MPPALGAGVQVRRLAREEQAHLRFRQVEGPQLIFTLQYDALTETQLDSGSVHYSTYWSSCWLTATRLRTRRTSTATGGARKTP